MNKLTNLKNVHTLLIQNTYKKETKGKKLSDYRSIKNFKKKPEAGCIIDNFLAKKKDFWIC